LIGNHHHHLLELKLLNLQLQKRYRIKNFSCYLLTYTCIYMRVFMLHLYIFIYWSGVYGSCFASV